MNKKINSALVITVIIIVAGILTMLIWFSSGGQKQSSQIQSTAQTPSVATTYQQYDKDSWKKIIPETCKKFNDGCNECTRINKDSAGCTKIGCSKYGKPYCLDTKIDPSDISSYKNCTKNEDCKLVQPLHACENVDAININTPDDIWNNLRDDDSQVRCKKPELYFDNAIPACQNNLCKAIEKIPNM
jgi:hypothetical protein